MLSFLDSFFLFMAIHMYISYIVLVFIINNINMYYNCYHRS